jgi:hypothetical protein
MLHLPDGGVVAPEYQDLTKRLQEGDGINWPGDPRMYLSIGVLTAPSGRQGRRIEVWRLNEDGSDTMVAHWHPSEQARILYDLAIMRVDRPGYVSVEDRIDAHNEAIEKEVSRAAQESMLETLDHAVRLHVDRHNPKSRFYMNDIVPPAAEPASSPSTEA